MTDTADGNGNGRVSQADRLARIETKLDYITVQLSGMGDYPALRERVDNHEHEIATLRTQSRIWDGINTVLAAAVAAVMGTQR